MAKYLKQNQIKAGTTIYVTHPKFGGIECKYVTSRPVKDKSCVWEILKYKYKTVNYFDTTGKKASPVKEFKLLGLCRERDGYCGDDGIPDKNGVFCYEQERRAFPTLNKALEYWVSQQTPENIKRWKEEDRDNEWSW